jgi:hypothetical protein
MINLNAFFEAVARCQDCEKPHLACSLRDGLCPVCLASRSRTLALAAQSVPEPLVSLVSDVVREAHALVTTQAEIASRHVETAEAHDLFSDDVSDAARAIYDGAVPADLCDRIHRAAHETHVPRITQQHIDRDLAAEDWPVLAATLDAAARFGGGPRLAALAAELRAVRGAA